MAIVSLLQYWSMINHMRDMILTHIVTQIMNELESCGVALK